MSKREEKKKKKGKRGWTSTYLKSAKKKGKRLMWSMLTMGDKVSPHRYVRRRHKAVSEKKKIFWPEKKNCLVKKSFVNQAERIFEPEKQSKSYAVDALNKLWSGARSNSRWDLDVRCATTRKRKLIESDTGKTSKKQLCKEREKKEKQIAFQKNIY